LSGESTHSNSSLGVSSLEEEESRGLGKAEHTPTENGGPSKLDGDGSPPGEEEGSGEQKEAKSGSTLSERRDASTLGTKNEPSGVALLVLAEVVDDGSEKETNSDCPLVETDDESSNWRREGGGRDTSQDDGGNRDVRQRQRRETLTRLGSTL
jgi:hypothetical protein